LPLLAQRIPEPPYKPIIALVAKPWYFAENGKSEITATFFDPIEQRPIASGQPVTFTVSNGTFVKEQDRQEWTTTTDASGIANATLFANDNTDTGPSLVTVSIASDSYAGSEKIQVYIVPDEGLYLAISPQTLQMADTRSIEVKLYDRENNLVTPPAEIILTPQDDAIVRIVDEAPEIRTTRNGVFNTAIQCRKKGDTSVTVEALLTGAEPQRIDVTCEAGDPHTINLTSSNTERDNGVYRIEINEEEDAVFTATVTDKKGTPLEDIPLSFTWYALTEDVPAMPVVLPDTEQTDEAGEVEVTLKNPELSVGEFFLSAEAEEVNEYVRVNYYASKCSGDDTEQSSNDQMEDAAQLKAGWACEGSFETASADTMTDTVDYFSFKVPEQSPDGEISPGQKYTVTLTLTNIPPGADYDLTLWATDSRTPLSGRPAFNNQPETIEVKLTPGTYYAKVLLRDRATRSDNTYTISYESHSGTQSQEP
jgi:HSP20 family molecular chaperone IbpA